RFKIAQFAFGTSACKPPAFERRHARRVIAAVFQALERIDQLRSHRLAAENPDNSAHGRTPLDPRTESIPRRSFTRNERRPRNQEACHSVTNMANAFRRKHQSPAAKRA